MKTRLNLKPGQRGTKKLCAKYGDTLVCVRYRYDDIKKKRYKTVELIIDEVDWKPETRKRNVSPRIVAIRVDPSEIKIKDRIKDEGGKWNRRTRRWEAGYDDVIRMGLKERIVEIINE